MRCLADRFVVVLDANVLYPFRIRDALLRFAEAGLFRARWSPAIIDEWRRNLVAQQPEFEASIDAQIAAMRIAFPEGCVTCQTAFKRGSDSLLVQISGLIAGWHESRSKKVELCASVHLPFDEL